MKTTKFFQAFLYVGVLGFLTLMAQAATVTPSATPKFTLTPTSTDTPITEILVYPNPYRPSRAVGGTLKFTGLQIEDVLRIYTVTAEKVFETFGITGRFEWDGRNSEGSQVASGIYIWVLERPNNEKHMGKIIIIIK